MYIGVIMNIRNIQTYFFKNYWYHINAIKYSININKFNNNNPNMPIGCQTTHL